MRHNGFTKQWIIKYLQHKETEEPIKTILASSQSVKDLFMWQILNKSKLGVA